MLRVTCSAACDVARRSAPGCRRRRHGSRSAARAAGGRLEPTFVRSPPARRPRARARALRARRAPARRRRDANGAAPAAAGAAAAARGRRGRPRDGDDVVVTWRTTRDVDARRTSSSFSSPRPARLRGADAASSRRFRARMREVRAVRSVSDLSSPIRSVFNARRTRVRVRG